MPIIPQVLNRRNRFILPQGWRFNVGYDAMLVPTYFSYVFKYSEPNKEPAEIPAFKSSKVKVTSCAW